MLSRIIDKQHSRALPVVDQQVSVNIPELCLINSRLRCCELGAPDANSNVIHSHVSWVLQRGSLIYKRKRQGPNTDFWCSPERVGEELENPEPALTVKGLTIIKLLTRLNNRQKCHMNLVNTVEEYVLPNQTFVKSTKWANENIPPPNAYVRLSIRLHVCDLGHAK